MKKRVCFLLLGVIVCFVFLHDAFASCEITLTAEGENVGAPYKSTVVIGIGMAAESLPAAPYPPAYTCTMNIPLSNGSRLAKDIRQCGNPEYCWIVGIDRCLNIPPPCDKSCTLSWDVSKLGNGTFELREGDCHGPLVVSDMSAEGSFQLPENKNFFAIVYRPDTFGVADAISVLRFLANSDREFDPCKPALCLDINNDGKIGLAESLFILNKIAGIR